MLGNHATKNNSFNCKKVPLVITIVERRKMLFDMRSLSMYFVLIFRLLRFLQSMIKKKFFFFLLFFFVFCECGKIVTIFQNKIIVSTYKYITHAKNCYSPTSIQTLRSLYLWVPSGHSLKKTKQKHKIKINSVFWLLLYTKMGI